MNDSLLEKTQARFCSASIRNVWAKFKVNRSCHFGTGAHEKLTTKKSFLSKFL